MRLDSMFILLYALVPFAILMYYIIKSYKRKNKYEFFDNPFYNRKIKDCKYEVLKYLKQKENEGWEIIEMPMKEQSWLFKRIK